MPSKEEVFELINSERDKQDEKWGDTDLQKKRSHWVGTLSYVYAQFIIASEKGLVSGATDDEKYDWFDKMLHVAAVSFKMLEEYGDHIIDKMRAEGWKPEKRVVEIRCIRHPEQVLTSIVPFFAFAKRKDTAKYTRYIAPCPICAKEAVDESELERLVGRYVE